MMNKDQWLTPPALARLWGVAADKVLYFIHSGQLKAINLAENPIGRPRFRIDWREVERFEQARSTQPPVKRHRRRRRGVANVGKQYF